MSKSNFFNCKSCGDRFSLNKTDFESFQNGKFLERPDTCYHCIKFADTQTELIDFQ